MERLLKIWIDLYPDDPLWLASRVIVAIVSTVTAICFAFTASTVIRSVRNFVDRATATRQEKDLALLALSASQTETETVRTEAQSRLMETTGRFQMLVEGVRDHALFTVDAEGHITSWNRGGERLLGYTEDEVLGKHFSLMLTSEDRSAGTPDFLLQKAINLRTSEDEGWRVRSDGDQLTLALDNANQLKNMVSDPLDITRIETHKLTVTSQPTNLVRLATEVLNTCKTNAVGRNIRLKTGFAPNLPFVWADPASARFSPTSSTTESNSLPMADRSRLPVILSRTKTAFFACPSPTPDVESTRPARRSSSSAWHR